MTTHFHQIRYRPDGRRTSEYMAWIDMRRRCYNEFFFRYHRYGGRGIKVCDRWNESFENFYEDMGPKTSPELTLERRENDKDYSPENCVWATYEEQNSNTSFNHLITIDGRTQHLAGWCRERKLNIMTFYTRRRRGMTDEEALTSGRLKGTRRLKLTKQQIHQIRLAKRYETQKATADRFKISQSVVCKIQNHKW